MPKTQPRVSRRQLGPADVRAELDTWEAKYETPSDRLAEAFTDPVSGELVETEDFFAWSQAYAAWRHLRAG
ncbi:MAG TPA: hypothetical protein VHB02_08070 [Acidimicrobiales bacterium]|nr:hypothetical protein [Acidimicrobiales bacterium]